MDNDTIQKIKPEGPWAPPPPEAVTGVDYASMEGGQTTATSALHRPARAPRRRRRWFGWLGFPARKDAAQHLRMIGRHFLSLTGWRP